MEKETMKRAILPITQIDENYGQIDGVPSNPREILKENFELLKKDVKEYPELLDYKRLKVYPLDGRYVVIDGNMRLRAMRENGVKNVPVYILDEDTDTERLKAYVILSNASFGRYDYGKLMEWDASELPSWGLTLPEYNEDMVDDLFNEEIKENDIKITIAVPDEYKDMRDVIIDDIKILLSDYTDIKIIK